MRTSDQRGFTLVELLVGMTMALVILSATLTTFDGAVRNAKGNERRNASAETARNALDRQARQLRNLAKRLNNTAVIDRASEDDLIFQTSDPSRTWVRYCLDSTTPSRGRLWEANLSLPVGTTSSPVSAQMRSGCPGTGWTKTSVVADDVVNRDARYNQPVFYFLCTDGTAACASSLASYDRILRLTAQVHVDVDPKTREGIAKVTTGVYLRNQNQAPVARYVSTRVGPRTVLLNGSGSTDFEGRTLTYWWFKGTMPTDVACDRPLSSLDAQGRRTMWGGVLIGEGVTLTHTFPASDGVVGTPVRIGLVACDPGDRFGSAGVTELSTVPIQN